MLWQGNLPDAGWRLWRGRNSGDDLAGGFGTVGNGFGLRRFAAAETLCQRNDRAKHVPGAGRRGAARHRAHDLTDEGETREDPKKVPLFLADGILRVILRWAYWRNLPAFAPVTGEKLETSA